MRSTRFARAELAILTGGIALRALQFFNGRALWLDEVWLALNVLTRPLTGFFRPLADRQMSPLGFLWGEWLVTRVAGVSELALRAIPFAAGVAALIFFARLARRLLDPGPALLATALAALSPLLIFYSAEAKSYELDALLVILLSLATLDVSEQGATPRSLFRWALVAALTALASTPAPFIVGGCALALLCLPRFRSLRGLSQLALASAPAALLFALQLLTVYHSQATVTGMQRYWGDAFLAARFPQVIGGAVFAARGLFECVLFGTNPLTGNSSIPLPPKTLGVMLAVSLVGAVALYRRSLFSVLLVFAPVILAAVASLAQRWPLTPRLLLFAVPAVLLTVAAGLGMLTKLVPARARAPLFLTGSIVLLSAAAVGSLAALRHPFALNPTPVAMAEISSRHAPDATVYVEGFQVPACTYYSVWHPDHARLSGDPTAHECAIRGARMVLGVWPPNGTPARAQWAQSESARILASGSSEVWLLLRDRSATEDLSAALERAGAERIATQQFAHVRLMEYRRKSAIP